MLDVLITPAAWDDADVRRLTADQQAELRARYDGAGEPGVPPSAADVAVVLDAGRVVEEGPSHVVGSTPRSETARRLVAAAPDLAPVDVLTPSHADVRADEGRP